MSDGNISRAEKVLLYRHVCRAWQRSARLEEPFLTYVLGMAVVHLWEQLETELRLPGGLASEHAPGPPC